MVRLGGAGELARSDGARSIELAVGQWTRDCSGQELRKVQIVLIPDGSTHGNAYTVTIILHNILQHPLTLRNIPMPQVAGMTLRCVTKCSKSS